MNSPLVSICIPTFQAARWIPETLGAALAQVGPSFEVVVVDDASTDPTVEIARSVRDARLRVVVEDERAGIAGNWDRAVRASRGAYVLLLMQDDLLELGAIASMAGVLDRHASAGFVFAPRRIELEDPTAGHFQSWVRRYGSLHTRLGALKELNDGRTLYERMRAERFRLNYFGEPSAVMVRRTAYERVGLFNARLAQLLDEEMWIRLAFRFDVGFVDRPLVTVRVHAASATAGNDRAGAAWLDRLWLLEGLRESADISPTIGRTLEAAIWLATVRNEVGRITRGGSRGLARRSADLRAYLAYRGAARRPSLHGTLSPRDDRGA